MRGKQLDSETVYKIMLSMFATNNFAETGRQLDIPATTVEKIYKDNKNKPEFVELCAKKQDDFIEKATRIIDKALNRLEKSLDNNDEKIPVNNLSTVLGTLYDKRALAKGETTSNTGVMIQMDKKVEELSQ